MVIGFNQYGIILDSKVGRGLAPADSRQLRIRLTSGEFVPFFTARREPLKGFPSVTSPRPTVLNSTIIWHFADKSR